MHRRRDGGRRDPPSSEALAELVRQRDSAPGRWVWDDATRWYPGLLAAGVRVERCPDLRLATRSCGRSAHVDQVPAGRAGRPGWDALPPVAGRPSRRLFALDDPADRLDPLAELDASAGGRWRPPEARPAAGCCSPPSPPARSSPPRCSMPGCRGGPTCTTRMLTELLGPAAGDAAGGRRSSRGSLPRSGRRSAAGAEPRLPPRAAARRCRPRGCAVTTPAVGAAELDHPVIEPLLRVQEAAAAAQRQRLGLAGHLGARRPVPPGVRARRRGHRPLGDAAAAARCSCRSRSAAPAVADPGWRLVVADAAQLEPRVLAAMAGDDARWPRPAGPRPVPGHGRQRRRRDPGRGQGRHARRDVRRRPGRERAADAPAAAALPAGDRRWSRRRPGRGSAARW